MATKRETPVKKRAKKKTVDPQAAAPSDGMTLGTSEVPEIKTTGLDDDSEVLRGLVAMEAYYLAERRGFIGGHEEEDWIAAEAVVRSRNSVNSR